MNYFIIHRFRYLFILILLSFSLVSYAVVRSNPLNFPGANKAQIGIYIEDIATGEVLYDVNGLLPLTPASITKALTSASILTLRDTSERFSTNVYVHGDINAGVLRGNVVVHCVGDPTIESSHFDNTTGFADSIANAVVSLGIETIEGTVIIDESDVPYDIEPRGWDDEDIVWPYGAGHYGANYKDNKFVLSYPSKKTVPFVPELSFSHIPANRSLTIERERGTKLIKTKGTPKKGGESITISMPDPAAVMRNDIIEALKKRNVVIDNKLKSPKGDKKNTIYSYQSPALGDILKSLMFRSDNMMAESMLRFISPGKTRADAIRTEMNMWELRDIDTDDIILEDGSGLSRNDRLTAYFLADVFAWMASHVKAREYADIFPKAGKDGTLKNFLKETPLEGRIALKTGSMKHVQCYAGYLLGEDDLPSHVIIFMINNFNCGRASIVSEVENLLLKTFAPDYVPKQKTITSRNKNTRLSKNTANKTK